MFYQSNQRGKRNSINKSIVSNITQNQQLPWIGTQRYKNNKSKTQAHEYLNGSDSLQQFQNQLHSMMKSIKSKRQNTKKRLLPFVNSLQTSKQSTKSQVKQIRSQISELKKVVEKQSSTSNRQQFRIQDKLQRIMINLQNQRQLLKMQTQKAIRLRQISTYNLQHTPQFQPIYIPQPQMFYPPTSYYSNRTNRQKYRKWKNSPESQQSDEQEEFLIAKKKNTAQLMKKRKFERTKLNKTKTTPKKTRLRIFFLTVAYAIFLRSQARKSAIARRKKLQTNCKQQFFKHLGNLKNWILDAQKFAFSILLQKKNLNFIYFEDESNKLRTQKQNLIMKIVLLGINSSLKNIQSQKINIFVELLANLCLHRSFPINSFWTQYQMNQVCVSQTYGFFKIDNNLQKFLVCLLVFVKIFIFNMLLQPYKFDKQKFPKNEQPMTKNLKMISSVYYLMLKQLLLQYLNEPRDIKFFKMGNYAQAKFAKVKCSQSLIYGKGKQEENQYISGLFTQDQLQQLKNHADWKKCINNLRQIIDKLHQEAVKYKKLMNKRKK